MRFNIPEIGTQITLAEDWTFDLHHEYRNKTLFEVLELSFVETYWRTNPAPIRVTMPRGTVLKVDRIYIRKGQGMSEFSSVTFLAPGKKTRKREETRVGRSFDGTILNNEGTPFTYIATHHARGVRFWVKLSDANNIVMEEN